MKKYILLGALVSTGILLSACSTQNPGQTNNPDQQGAQNQTDDSVAGQPNRGSGQPGKGEAPQLDFAAAAAKLGVTEDQLKAAMAGDENNRPDLATAAAKLGVTADALKTALGMPENMPDRPTGEKPNGNMQAPTGSPAATK